MLKLEINHDKFREKLEKDPQMKEWYTYTRFTRAAYMHCRRFKTCPYNPFLTDKPSHKHDWEMKDLTVIEKKENDGTKAGN